MFMFFVHLLQLETTSYLLCTQEDHTIDPSLPKICTKGETKENP